MLDAHVDALAQHPAADLLVDLNTERAACHVKDDAGASMVRLQWEAGRVQAGGSKQLQ